MRNQWRYCEPPIDYRTFTALRSTYTDTDGNQQTQLLEALPVAVFLQLCERICSPGERATARLARLLAGSLDLADSATRWWLLTELLRAGATLDGICIT